VKSQLRAWLEDAEFQKIVDASLENGRTINVLVTLTYDENPLVCWRALDAIGRCAEHLCRTRAESLKNVLRRLFWMMSDESGALAWHAPEAIGEIVRSDPRAFADFIPMTVALLDLEPEDRPPFLPGILFALGRIGRAAPDTVKEGLASIAGALAESDTQVRAMAIWCLGQVGERDVLLRHHELGNDQRSAVVYRKEQLKTTTVGTLWKEAVSGALTKQEPNILQ
jgi:HEAT repeat protein